MVAICHLHTLVTYDFSSLKQLIPVQTRQNRYQTIPFSVYIHNLMFVFTSEWVFWKEPWYDCDFITYTHRWLDFSSLKQLILGQTRQNRYQTIPFSVYVHNLMFVFTLEWVFLKEPWYGCDFATYTHWWLTTFHPWNS